MKARRKPNGFWDIKENCQAEALKYETKFDFQKGSNGAYRVARENKWLDEICDHMIMVRYPMGYWTKENCHEEAKKYKTRNNFQDGSPFVYKIACENKWMDEICDHMIPQGNRINRYIYIASFLDGSVYIGLTYNMIERTASHKNRNSVIFDHIKLTKTEPTFTLYDGILYSPEKVILLEKQLIKEYRDLGYNVLNKSDGGELGGNHLIWTKDKCIEEALKYNTKTAFKYGSNGAWDACQRYGWLQDVCSHMIEIKKPNGYWTKEKCEEEALKFNSRKDFELNSSSAYNASCKNKWLNEICDHMNSNKKPNGYWTKEKCEEEALKYTTKYAFRYGSSGAYDCAYNNGWLDEFFPKSK